MVKVIEFHDAIKDTEEQDRALLVGNGFSSKYFKYESLLAASELKEGEPLRKLFAALKTFDFESVVRALESAAVVESAYGHDVHAIEMAEHAREVREALVKAINATHPAHRNEIASECESGASFLNHFGTVFSLNYDLLLYWVNLEKTKLNDGFGLGETTADLRFHGPFIEAAYCHIFNLHGSLHLFESDAGEVFKALNTDDGVIATITHAITNKHQLPLYVAEGTSRAKMQKINSVDYRRHCYAKLNENAASVFVFGHSADDNDAHIYRAIFASRAKHVYFGVFEPNEEKLRNLDGQLSKYKKIGGKDVSYSFYDSASAYVWDQPK